MNHHRWRRKTLLALRILRGFVSGGVEHPRRQIPLLEPNSKGLVSGGHAVKRGAVPPTGRRLR